MKDHTAILSTVIYSGFTEKDSTDGSDRNTNYQNTHLAKLIKDGKISGFSENWSIEAGLTYNTDYAPNAIDPALFYDEEGKLTDQPMVLGPAVSFIGS